MKSENNITPTPTGTLIYRMMKWLRISIPEPNHLILRSTLSLTPGRVLLLISKKILFILGKFNLGSCIELGVLVLGVVATGITDYVCSMEDIVLGTMNMAMGPDVNVILFD
tara:strand:+ start:598 stop:930 length:333 start_codon:yes stop_codon:yes gene_type:complete